MAVLRRIDWKSGCPAEGTGSLLAAVPGVGKVACAVEANRLIQIVRPGDDLPHGPKNGAAGELPTVRDLKDPGGIWAGGSLRGLACEANGEGPPRTNSAHPAGWNNHRSRGVF